MYEDRLLQVQEWWLSDRLYILKDKPTVFGNPDYQMNSSSVQKQLKAAGIDTNSKKYKAVLSEMMKNGNGAMFTNVQAIKNLMSQYPVGVACSAIMYFIIKQNGNFLKKVSD